jgi:hypothetical protein
VETDHSFMGGFAVAWIFKKSSRSVERQSYVKQGLINSTAGKSPDELRSSQGWLEGNPE